MNWTEKLMLTGILEIKVTESIIIDTVVVTVFIIINYFLERGGKPSIQEESAISTPFWADGSDFVIQVTREWNCLFISFKATLI
jgi:hypothetical protein